jgi:hypothetical protein
LHLTYTRSYWIDLCKNTIGKDIHHNPTEGGAEEDRKFRNLYNETLKLYEEYFSSKPPVLVWPENNEAVHKKAVEINESRHWSIPKPAFGFWRRRAALIILLTGIAGFAISCDSSVEVFSMVLVIPLIIGAGYFLTRRFGGRHRTSDSGCGSIILGDSDGDSGSGDNGSSCSSDGGGSGCSSGCSGGCGGGGD